MKAWLPAAAALVAALAATHACAADDDASAAAHFHHVRLNVTDPDKTIDFYARNLGAVEVAYNGRVPALFTERSFILLNQVDTSPPYLPHSAISHIGWGSVDGPADYEWLKSRGVEFETPVATLGNNHGMYFYGPNKELIELWTGERNHRFNHVHLWASDVAATTDWYRKHLGLTVRMLPKPKTQDREDIRSIWMAFMQCDNVSIVVFGRPDFDSRWWPGGSYTAQDAPQEFQPTEGRAIDHVAFSYRRIKPVYERLHAAGVEIVQPIAQRDVGHKSFFVMAPDKVLVEIVEARPIPDASWE